MTLRFIELDDTADPDPAWLLDNGWCRAADDELRAALTRWRFGERPPGGLTCLALHDDQCVGMIDFVPATLHFGWAEDFRPGNL